MIALGLEPEPLAFRVRPQVEECVDSWLDRLTAAHETTRAALFRHLGIDSVLAGMDLARGKHGLDGAWYGAFDHMVERLAWAVQTGNETVSQTFLACRQDALLPRRLRHYACPGCWYEARRDRKPRIIRREWILRACWRCRDHHLPLSDMSEMRDRIEDRYGLAGLVIQAERMRCKILARPAALRMNATALNYLTQPAEWRGLAPPHESYQRRFTTNLYHYSSHRIALLVLAHSHRSRSARQFERLISTRLPDRPTAGSGTLAAPPRPYRLRRPRLPLRSPRQRRGPEFLDLLFAYCAARRRGDAVYTIETIHARVAALTASEGLPGASRGGP